MKKIKSIFSTIITICIIITIIPLNIFAANSAKIPEFIYEPPEDITIYKNQTEKVELRDYVYTYDVSDGYESCDIKSISVKSNNANVELTQPVNGMMKVKGLKEGKSTVTIQYSWVYSGSERTGTKSFDITVKDFQYFWEMNGDAGYYEDGENNGLYIDESAQWTADLRKIYYNQKGVMCRQKVKNFDILTKTYRRIEEEDEEGDTYYKEITDNSLLSVAINNDEHSIAVTAKKEAECYLDVQVRYQGEIIKTGDGNWKGEDKETRSFNIVKDSYEILNNSSAYYPLGEGDTYPEFQYLSVGQKVKVKCQLLHIYYDKVSGKRKTEILSDAVIKAYYSQKDENGESKEELTSKTKVCEHTEMSFQNNTLMIKVTNANLGVDEDGWVDDYCAEYVDLDAYVSGKKIVTSGIEFEISQNLQVKGEFSGIDNGDEEDNKEYDEEYVHLKKNASKKVDIGHFSIKGSDWNWDKDEAYQVDSVEAVSSDSSVAIATIPKIDKDGDYYCTFRGKKSGSAIITFNYTYTFNDISYKGSQKVEVVVGYSTYTSYELRFVAEKAGCYMENKENSSDDLDWLEMRKPYNTTLTAKVYKISGDDDGNTSETEVHDFTLKCEEYEDEYDDEYEKRGTIRTDINNSNHSIKFTGEEDAYCIYKIGFDLGNKTENQYDKIPRYISVYSKDDVEYKIETPVSNSDDVILLREGESFPINLYKYDNDHPDGIKANDAIVQMKSSGKGLEIDNNNKLVTGRQVGKVSLTVDINTEDENELGLEFYVIPKENEELYLDKEQKLQEDGGVFSFTPQKTGQYRMLEMFKEAMKENLSSAIEVFDSNSKNIKNTIYTDTTYKKVASFYYNLEAGKTYYFVYDKSYSYSGSGKKWGWDKFDTSPERISLTYVENEEQDCEHADTTKREVKNAKAATCITDGYTGDIYCTICGEQIENGKVIKSAGHKWNEGIITKAPTETENGIKTYTCTACNTTKTEQIKATGKKENTKPNNTTKPGKATLKVGTKITDKATEAIYKVTGSNTVEYVKCNTKKNKVSIPQKIIIKGSSYQVTSIAPKAFKGNKKLKSVVIPSTIRKIGKEAFAKGKNLKSITINTPYLSKKTVGANAFKGIHAKAKIKVPKKQKKTYQKLLKSKGVGKKAKIK